MVATPSNFKILKSAVEQLMSDQYLIEVQQDVKPADMNVMVEALSDFNASKVEGEMPRYLMITMRDSEQNLVGGLVGATYLGWLQVHTV